MDVTLEEMRDFLYYMLDRAGADTMITPREIIRAYLTALGLVMQGRGERLPDVYKKASASFLPTEEDAASNDFDPETIEF